jgi:hypothetical protein
VTAFLDGCESPGCSLVRRFSGFCAAHYWEREATRLQVEVERLRALVDAATRFRFGRVRVVQFGAGHWAVEEMNAKSSREWCVVKSFSFAEREAALAFAHTHNDKTKGGAR